MSEEDDLVAQVDALEDENEDLREKLRLVGAKYVEALDEFDDEVHDAVENLRSKFAIIAAEDQ